MDRRKRRTRRRLVILVIAVVLVAGIAALAALRGVRRDHSASQARVQGLAAYERGEYQAALPKLAASVRRRPQDLEVLLALADSRSRVFEVNNRHLTDAGSYYQAALRLDPDNLDAMRRLLDLYYRLGHRVEAARVADRILELDPDDVDALSARAVIALRDDPEEAATLLKRLYTIEPDKLTWRWLHIRAIDAAGADRASMLRLCDEWIAAYDGDGRFRVIKAQLLVDQGDYDAARTEMIEAIRFGTDSRPVLDSMLGLLNALDLRDEAKVTCPQGLYQVLC